MRFQAVFVTVLIANGRAVFGSVDQLKTACRPNPAIDCQTGHGDWLKARLVAGKTPLWSGTNTK